MKNENPTLSKEQLIEQLSKHGLAVRDTTMADTLPEPRDLPEGYMRVANCLLILNKERTITKLNVTPGEVAVLVSEHVAGTGRMPIINLVEIDPIVRTNYEEFSRLKGRYDARLVQTLFGAQAALPGTYQEAVHLGMNTTSTQERFLTQVNLAG